MDSCPWDGFQKGSITFCEQRLCSWIVEPANTWSNIGFFLVGLWILWKQWQSGRPDLVMVGITSAFVGINSALFHATGTRWGEIVDLSAMYFISSLFITLSMYRIWRIKPAILIPIYVLLATITSAIMIFSGTNGIFLFALHITGAVLLEGYFFKRFRGSVKYSSLTFMAGCFTISFISWKLDVSKVICDPDNHIFGGHALWHLGNAASLWFYYRHQSQFKNV